jgi:glutathione S-transferase
MPILLLKLVFQRMPLGVPFLIRPIARAISKKAQTTFIDPQMTRHMAYWNAELSKAPWFAGDAFSAADIQMSFPLEGAEARFNLDGYPAVRAFLKQVRGRPAYKRAIERGGALTLLRK